MLDMRKAAEIASQAPEWQDRKDRPKITMDRWGKDHWSLLAYVESVGVNLSKRIEWNRLTLSARNWPMLYAARGRYSQLEGRDSADAYPLRLKRSDDQPQTAPGQCEGDALMDLVDAGLVRIEMPQADRERGVFLKPNGRPLDGEDAPHPAWVTGLTEWQLMPWARFPLTDLGRHYNNALRAHKSTDGATWSNFTPPPQEA